MRFAHEPALILPLPRPEYPGGPEAFLTAIAWSAAGSIEFQIDTGAKTLGLAYLSEKGKSDPTTVHLETTYPHARSMPGWNAALGSAGLFAEDAESGPAVAYALRGVRPDKGYTIPASPLTKHTSLLQNPVGLTRKANPFNAALMLERIYALGAEASDGYSTVAGGWLIAMDQRTRGNHLLRAIDEAVLHNRLSFLREPPQWQTRVREESSWRDTLSRGTPFAWFYKAWRTLTSPEWIIALPPRVWIDWATAVMRMGLGFAYLWEAQWYERLARFALKDAPDEVLSIGEVVASVSDVLPWRPRTESISLRDVVSPMKARIGRGVAIREVLLKRLSETEPERALEQLRQLRTDSDAQNALKEALSRTSTKNVWEAVRYALAARSDSGPQADFYGLLRNAGTRYAVVDPGTEWTALMAALAVGRPNHRGTVADVRTQLASLGLHPDLGELVSLLEEAGLARGSADADQAVEVQSPY